MTKPDLETVLKQLWNNWAFRLMQSSNELFHSNVLQYLVETSATSSSGTPLLTNPGQGECPEDSAATSGPVSSGDKSGDGSEPTAIDRACAVRLLEVLCGIDCARCKPAFDKLTNAPVATAFVVKREWKHMDLAVLMQNAEKKWLPIFALEVKVKAYPEPEQLERYRKVLNANWKKENNNVDQGYYPPLFLLTGMGEDAIKGIGETYSVNFETLRNGLATWPNGKDPVAEKYLELCTSLHKLFAFLQENLNVQTTWKSASDIAKQLEPYRLHSLWWKLWASDVAKQCEKVAGTKICTNYLHVHSGYTRTGNLGVCWKSSDAKGPSISIGVQIEDKSVRLFLQIVHPQLGAPQDARRVVEAVLLKLMASAGVFAANPGMQVLLDRWNSKNPPPYSNLTVFTRPIPVPAPPSSCTSAAGLFDGTVREGKKEGDFIPMLTGYANGQGNGFADVRLTLKGDCTIDAVAQMVCCVLVDDLFSASPKVANNEPLLLRVVKGFEKADKDNKVKEWIATPTPT